MRVLFTYDFTETSDSALAFLKELRRFGECDVVVAHVDSPPAEKVRLGLPRATPLGANEPALQRILERELSERVRTVLEGEGTPIRVKAGWGRPDFDLLQIGERERADLIVTGAHQRHGLERLLHMSVSRAVLRHATTNVLVVPACKEPAWAAPIGPYRILVATDFSEAGNRAVRYAYSLLRAGGAVRLVQVCGPHAYLGADRGPHHKSDRQQTLKMEVLRSGVDELLSIVPPDAAGRGIATEVEVVERRTAARSIAQAAERFGADMICLGTQRCSRIRSAMGDSVAQRVMRSSSRPLLVVPAWPE